MSIEKVLSGIEHVHAFTRAVSVGNPREFLQAEKEDQEMAEACKRLIKNWLNSNKGTKSDIEIAPAERALDRFNLCFFWSPWCRDRLQSRGSRAIDF